MCRQIVKDELGHPIGSLDYRKNGDVIVRDRDNVALGRYEAESDRTEDYYGKTVALGNAAVTLITLFGNRS